MNHVLVIGDSNVYRNCTMDRLSRRLNCSVKLMEAPRLHSLEVALKEVKRVSYNFVLISCLPNLLCDFVNDIDPSTKNFDQKLKECITDYVHLIQSNCDSKQSVLYVPALYLSLPVWFPEFFVFINRVLKDHVTVYPCSKVLPLFRVDDLSLMPDGEHLDLTTGAKFFDYLVSCLLDMVPILPEASSVSFSAPSATVTTATASVSSLSVTSISASASTPLPSDDTATTADVMRFLRGSVAPKLDELTGVTTRVDKIEKKLSSYIRDVDVVLTRHSDEFDNLRNEKSANRVLVIGYPSDNYPTVGSERKDFLVSKFRPFVERILGEVVIDIYPSAKGPKNNTVPPFDLRFVSVKDCNKFKKSAFKHVRELVEDGSVSFLPKLVLGTRVRQEILRAISKKVQDSDLAAYCPIYELRPVLHLGPLRDGRVVRTETLNFVDSVMRFRHLINVTDLDFAYSRVGNCTSMLFPKTFSF